MRRRLPVAVVSLFAALAPLAVSTPAGAADGTVAGIDVSRWQGAIDWGTVAGTNVRFAILRATKAKHQVDETYAVNLAGATSAGLVVGAYHRATPSDVKHDATAEAKHFLSVARNAPGDVLPVLDIEEDGGLSVTQLQDWVRAWVERVYARIGVKPLLYASPYFWRTFMGDTHWFANHGYPLWIANWNVPAPDVYADDWGGHGWTYWQWTSTGRVAGIVGDVDRDRFNGTDLQHGVIASFEMTRPEGGTIEGPRVRCGTDGKRCERLANPDTVLTLIATPDPGAELLGWTGACAPAGTSPTCDLTALGTVQAGAVFGYPLAVVRHGGGGGAVSSAPGGIACEPSCTSSFATGTEVTLTATPDALSMFTGWGGACDGTDPTCTITVGGPVDVSASFEPLTVIQEDGPGTDYRWGRATNPDALGGSYRWDRAAGAAETYAFAGGRISVFTIAGPAFGIARVAVDGARIASIDGYAPSFRVRRSDLTDLGPGAHTLTVTATGRKRPAATGTKVGVDALRSGGDLATDPAPAAGVWGTFDDPQASGGAARRSGSPGATASLSFTGSAVALRTTTGPASGRAKVRVDGAVVGTIDLYSATPSHVTVPLVTDLPSGPHLVRITVLDAPAPESTGTSVVVDAWHVA